ncbi:MAG: glycosyltransferase [Planctomycetia bacterium]|nr:glycosyltransferase [Planctomycetia bacterium]
MESSRSIGNRAKSKRGWRRRWDESQRAIYIVILSRRWCRDSASVRIHACSASPPRSRRKLFLWPQTQGDLGSRMASFFDDCFRDGAGRVVLIGSDSPTVPTEFVESAFRLLGERDVVLGPTDDGGYYLVGASREVAGIFEHIDWSTERVWDQTVARLGEIGLSCASLPQWYDVDEVKDLERLRDELSLLANDDSAFSELFAAIHRV